MTNTSGCPVCKRDDATNKQGEGDYRNVCCPRCGPYSLTGLGESLPGQLEQLADDKLICARASHAVRSQTSDEQPFEIKAHNVEEIINFPLPDLKAQLENFIDYLKKEAADVQSKEINIKDRNALLGVVGAIDEGALGIVVTSASERGLVVLFQDGNSVRLAPKAWEDDPQPRKIGFNAE